MGESIQEIQSQMLIDMQKVIEQQSLVTNTMYEMIKEQDERIKVLEEKVNGE